MLNGYTLFGNKQSQQFNTEQTNWDRSPSTPNVKSWRDSNDYRRDYFKKNNGLFGTKIYICSQCFVPMIDKDKIQVDHIFPPSLLSKKSKYKNSSFLSEALNNSFNLTSICQKCNLKKSNKLGGYFVKGALFKATSSIISFAAKAGIFVSAFALSSTLKLLMMGFKRRRGKKWY